MADPHLDVLGSTAQHFLGAIVVQAQDNPMGKVLTGSSSKGTVELAPDGIGTQS